MDVNNPVVILDGETWHIAENGRSSKVAHCGKTMTNQRTHSRVSTIGLDHVCKKCVQRYRLDFPNVFHTP